MIETGEVRIGRGTDDGTGRGEGVTRGGKRRGRGINRKQARGEYEEL